jgi:hypothetical protein
LDNLKPENNSNKLNRKSSPLKMCQSLHHFILVFNVLFIQTLHFVITMDQITIRSFFGVDAAGAEDDEGYTYCPQYLTEGQYYGKIVMTPGDGQVFEDIRWYP